MEFNSPPLPSMALLRLLKDGGFHSVATLAKMLDLSSDEILKQINQLISLGLNLASKPGHYYCLLGGLELLCPLEIKTNIHKGLLDSISSFIILPAVDSTSAYLMRQPPDTGISVCLAEFQWAGRGRRGRSWISPHAGNIYLSISISSSQGMSVYEGLSLAIGVAVAQALAYSTGEDFQLKWPNDVMHNGNKIGGILIDIVASHSQSCNLVVGIGINLRSEKSMAASICQPWTALDKILVHPPCRNELVASLLNYVLPLLKSYHEVGFIDYREKWEALNMHAHQHVVIQQHGQLIRGIVRGVNDTGALKLETQNGLEVYHTGEVSLRSEK